MKFLVLDFETTGLYTNSADRYVPYAADVAPLPRDNYPVELAAALVGADGRIEKEMTLLVRGATRLSPWVHAHCPHLSVAACERDGVDFMEALQRLSDMVVGTEQQGVAACTLVAHNLQYDWDEVIVRTVHERGETDHAAFVALNSLPKWCTCVNPFTKGDRSAYYWRKLGKWIGPKLGDLCRKHGVAYDADAAHAALYDVQVTAQCLWRQKGGGSDPARCVRV